MLSAIFAIKNFDDLKNIPRIFGIFEFFKEKIVQLSSSVFALLCMVLGVFSGCQSTENQAVLCKLKNEKWPLSQTLSFPFSVGSPSEKMDFVYRLCYSPSYPYDNIWLRYCLVGPQGDTLTQSVDNLFVFESKTGRPLGQGFAERYYMDAYFLKGVSFQNPGKYKVLVRQYMRQDTLPGLQSLGCIIRAAGT